MSITHIYIARHGETEYNRLNKIQGRTVDISLNKRGKMQARSIAQALEGTQLDKIFCSSLKRTHETAEIIANGREMQPEGYADLDEMHFGLTEGKHSDEIGNYLEEAYGHWREGNIHYKIPGGESPVEVWQRAGTRANSLVKEWEGSNLLFILHGRLIRIIISNWLGYGLEAMHKVEHQNGAMYHLKWDGNEFEPIYLNKTKHLTLVT